MVLWLTTALFAYERLMAESHARSAIDAALG